MFGINNLTTWEIHISALLLRIRWEHRYHSHICWIWIWSDRQETPLFWAHFLPGYAQSVDLAKLLLVVCSNNFSHQLTHSLAVNLCCIFTLAHIQSHYSKFYHRRKCPDFSAFVKAADQTWAWCRSSHLTLGTKRNKNISHIVELFLWESRRTEYGWKKLRLMTNEWWIWI